MWTSVWCKAFLVLFALLAAMPGAGAAEVTLRMRGGSFEIKGNLKSYDLRNFVVVSPGLGTLSLDATRYECIAGACPSGAVEPPRVSRLPFAPTTTTIMGGSAIGTEFMPRLVRAYAASIGASVDMQIGGDPKNLEFTLKASDGRLVGKVNVNRQGVPQGFVALAKGQADMVWASRAILPEEEQIMATAGTTGMRQAGREHVWALDALVVLVAKENPVVSLSLDDIARIFSGQVKDWGELGLPPGKINVYAPSAEMGTWSYFDNTILRPRNLLVAADAVRLDHATEWSDKVAADPRGISINSIAYVRKAKPLNIEISCGIVLRPSVFAAKTEEYPLTRRLYFYTAGTPKNPLAAELLAFAMSRSVQPVLKEARFVDQDPEQSPFIEHSGRIAIALNAPAEDYDGALMARLIEDISKAERLSISFRFLSGTATLDARANEDIGRLATYIQQPSMAGRTVLLLGFADAIGRFDNNLAISRKRAQAVRGALQKGRPQLARPEARILDRAYGELAPVACNDTDEGKAFNRRVEVWIQ